VKTHLTAWTTAPSRTPRGPALPRPSRSLLSLHPVKDHRRRPQGRWRTVSSSRSSRRPAPPPAITPAMAVVEVNGIEPMTSCLQSRRSPS
jgi:hypothetical protein